MDQKYSSERRLSSILTGHPHVARTPPTFSVEEANSPDKSASITTISLTPRCAKPNATLLPSTPAPMMTTFAFIASYSSASNLISFNVSTQLCDSGNNSFHSRRDGLTNLVLLPDCHPGRCHTVRGTNFVT